MFVAVLGDKNASLRIRLLLHDTMVLVAEVK